MPNSSKLVLPIRTAPDFKSLSTTVALKEGTKSSSIFEAHVVVIPFVQKLSFIAIGAPSRILELPTEILICTLLLLFNKCNKLN